MHFLKELAFYFSISGFKKKTSTIFFLLFFLKDAFSKRVGTSFLHFWIYKKRKKKSAQVCFFFFLLFCFCFCFCFVLFFVFLIQSYLSCRHSWIPEDIFCISGTQIQKLKRDTVKKKENTINDKPLLVVITLIVERVCGPVEHCRTLDH